MAVQAAVLVTQQMPQVVELAIPHLHLQSKEPTVALQQIVCRDITAVVVAVQLLLVVLVQVVPLELVVTEPQTQLLVLL
jgi:hypothetical protein